MKILLADDSMTAQNMGKKILSEAGYEVVAVSNGAQAVKKIASEKPDVAVLDVYMPGYTGLEVCERVKNAKETAKIPVLLTVGKMEPFKSEDGNRVRADGVIVKPFEASDLLAAVQKLAEQVVPAATAAAPAPQRTTEAIAPPDFLKDSSYEEWKVTAPEHVEEVTTGSAPPTRIEVPNEFAAAPAFGDFVGDETPAPLLPQEAAPSDHRTEIMGHPAMPEAPVESPVVESPVPAQFAEPSPFGLTPANPAFGQAFAPPSFDETQSIPVQPETPAEHHEVEFTSAPRVHEVEHAAAPGFEPTISQEDHPVSDFRDPALVTDATELSQFTTKFGLEKDEEIPVGVYTPPEEPPVEAIAEPAPEGIEQAAPPEAPPNEHPAEFAEMHEPAAVEATPEPPPADEFESRVAAAMSSYESSPEPVSAAPAEEPVAAAPEHVEPPASEAVAAPEPPPESAASYGWTAHETVVGALEHGLSLHEEMQKAFAAAVPAESEPAPLAEAPAPQPEPAPVADSHDALVAEMAAAIAGKEPEPAPAEQAMAAAAGASVAEAFDLPRAGSVVLEPGTLASIIHRVVERLKPELAAEIEKEIVEETKRKK